MTFFIGMILSALPASRRWSTPVLALLFVLAAVNSFQQASQSWGVYHYYIGAKYFAQFGYFDLYECTSDHPHIRRDLRSYNFRRDTPRCPIVPDLAWRDAFTRDLEAVGFEPRFMVDKGYNATPSWTALAQALIHLDIPLPVLLWIDALALAVGLLAVSWLAGWRKALLAGLLIVLWVGTLDGLHGHFLQWLWLVLVLVGTALLEQKRGPRGAALIGVAAGLAVFPVFLMLHYWRWRAALLWFVAGLLLALGVGLLTDRGAAAYPEFLHNMSIHSAYLRSEQCCNYSAAATAARLVNSPDYLISCFSSRQPVCAPEYHHELPAWWVLAIPLLLGHPLSLMYALITLSKYYWLIIAVLPLWERNENAVRIVLGINALMIAFWIADRAGIMQHVLFMGFFAYLSLRELPRFYRDSRLEVGSEHNLKHSPH